MNSLLRLSGTRLAELIRRREVTSREVVETHIARIRGVNSRLNALIQDRFDRARAEADRADEQVRAGVDGPPFRGVPCTIKEAMGLQGMSYTAGLRSRRGVLAPCDGTAVARLRRGGAIPLGVTNVPELCMWIETHNTVYGRTRNPYDVRRSSGGSSGGEGALIGAGASPFGIGSDIGGSIRIPAFFCGIFGHKPTGGLVPNTGHFPSVRGDANRYLTTGPLARRAEDLYPLLRLLAGPDGSCPGCREIQLGDPAGVKLGELAVFDVADDGSRRVRADLRAAQRRCADHLASLGARLRATAVERFRHAFLIFASMLSATNTGPLAELLGDGRPLRALPELERWLLGRSPYSTPAVLGLCLEPLAKLAPRRVRRFVEEGHALRQELIGMLGRDSVLLYPSYPAPAVPHRRTLLRPSYLGYPAIFNALEFPVTQVPLGLNADGLPLGVQVVAGPGQDHLTIAVALELERKFGGWIPPRLTP